MRKKERIEKGRGEGREIKGRSKKENEKEKGRGEGGERRAEKNIFNYNMFIASDLWR